MRGRLVNRCRRTAQFDPRIHAPSLQLCVPGFSNGICLRPCLDSIFDRVYCEDIIDKFYNYKIIYPKSDLGDHWGIKSNYEIIDYDDFHYIPIKKKA